MPVLLTVFLFLTTFSIVSPMPVAQDISLSPSLSPRQQPGITVTTDPDPPWNHPVRKAGPQGVACCQHEYNTLDQCRYPHWAYPRDCRPHEDAYERCTVISGTTGGGNNWAACYRRGFVEITGVEMRIMQCNIELHQKQHDQCITIPGSSCAETYNYTGLLRRGKLNGGHGRSKHISKECETTFLAGADRLRLMHYQAGTRIDIWAFNHKWQKSEGIEFTPYGFQEC